MISHIIFQIRFYLDDDLHFTEQRTEESMIDEVTNILNFQLLMCDEQLMNSQ